MAPSKAGVAARTFAFLTFIHVLLDGFTSSIKEGTMKRKTKRKRYTEPPCDDERIKFEKAFQEYLGQLSATFDGDGNLRDDAPSSGELPDPAIEAMIQIGEGRRGSSQHNSGD